MIDAEVLAARVDGLSGPDRELDAEIAEHVFGWKPSPVPADAKGENAGDVLTPDGQPFRVNGQHFQYPPLGRINRAYHCPAYTRDCIDPALPRNAIRKITAENIRASVTRTPKLENDDCGAALKERIEAKFDIRIAPMTRQQRRDGDRTKPGAPAHD